MAKHEVHFDLPSRELGNSDIRCKVRQDGAMLGTLAVSKGAVVWFPSGTTYGQKIGWAKFNELMKTNGNQTESR